MVCPKDTPLGLLQLHLVFFSFFPLTSKSDLSFLQMGMQQIFVALVSTLSVPDQSSFQVPALQQKKTLIRLTLCFLVLVGFK